MLIVDVLHVPTGCAVWPAFWTLGRDGAWPSAGARAIEFSYLKRAGEIDILEFVNLGDQNAYTLHTTAGCKLAQPMAATGTIKNDDCDTATTDNASCGVSEAPGSAGAKFNAAKGGVIAAMCVRAWGLSDESDGRARRFRCTTGRARRFRPT